VLSIDEAPMKWTDPSSFDPSLPTAACVSTPSGARATLTVLTGTQAGRLVPVDRAGVLVGRSDDADLVVRDRGVSAHHARIAPTGGQFFYVEDLRSTNGTFVGPTRIGVSLLEQGDGLRLGPQLRLRFARTDEMVVRPRHCDASIRDSLTGVFSRRYFISRLGYDVVNARRAGLSVFILMIGIDGMTQYEGALGRGAGDRALCAVVTQIREAVRAEGVIGRYRGDVFALLVPAVAGATGVQLADRIVDSIHALPVDLAERAGGLTVSVGLASLGEIGPTAGPVEALLALADVRFFSAKAAGRNCVCAH
jgi:diguanylate cyclase (GGDEF)-like protein